MPFSRRDFLKALTVLAAGGLEAACAGLDTRGPGARDPHAMLREVTQGRYAVALLADLETRTLIEPSDRVRAFRATHGVYATIKPLSYWAGLQQGVIQPDTPFFCNGDHCPFGGHGSIRAFEAVWRSCNAFFLELGPRLDPARFLELLRMAGYGRVTGLGGEWEVEGLLPDKLESDRDMALLASLGAGVRATPVQQLVMTLRFAVGGRSFPLDGKVIDGFPPDEQDRIELVRRAWRMHALRGVGKRADRKSYPLGSRTGSARGSGWYLGFGPFDVPRYVTAVHVGAPSTESGYPVTEAVRLGGTIFRRLA